MTVSVKMILDHAAGGILHSNKAKSLDQIVAVTTQDNTDELLSVDDYATRESASLRRTGFPLQSGASLSLWLQTVRANPLLDHRSTPQLPKSAEIVIIGSGVRALPAVAHQRSMLMRRDS